MKKEMNGLDIRHLESIDRLAMVLLRSEQLSDSVDREEASQPVPFVVMSDEEADIAVTALIPRSA